MKVNQQKLLHAGIVILLAGIVFGIFFASVVQRNRLDDGRLNRNNSGKADLSYIPPLIKAEKEPNDSFEQASQLKIGIETQGTISNPGDIDFYTFIIDTPSTLSVSLKNLPKENDMVIFDSNKKIIASVHRAGFSETTSLLTLPDAGKYFIKVSSNGNVFYSNPYSITLTLFPYQD